MILVKRWFIEPKPQVFVGSVNKLVREQVLQYIRQNSDGIKMLIIYSAQNCQGFAIEQINDPDYSGIKWDGLHLISTPQSYSVENYPF